MIWGSLFFKKGRIGKNEDSCYTFWNVAALRLLGFQNGVKIDKLRDFLLMCQSKEGGFMKFPWGEKSDPIHTCHSILGAALLGIFDLNEGEYDIQTGLFLH